jgi:hypothetical protein
MGLTALLQCAHLEEDDYRFSTQSDRAGTIQSGEEGTSQNVLLRVTYAASRRLNALKLATDAI